MEELRELVGYAAAARTELKALQRRTRAALRVVTDLEERLERILAAPPVKEGSANGSHRNDHASV